MSMITLASGGLDSTLLSVLAKEEGINQHPLFIDYGQLSRENEWRACLNVYSRLGLPKPKRVNLRDYGELIASGITNVNMRINEDAFLPGRNLLFLLVGSAYAYQTNSNTVAIGLLSEDSHIFPDQTEKFIGAAQDTINLALGRTIKIITPLMHFTKAHVLKLAREKGLEGTHSCHSDSPQPCNRCISCAEINNVFL